MAVKTHDSTNIKPDWWRRTNVYFFHLSTRFCFVFGVLWHKRTKSVNFCEFGVNFDYTCGAFETQFLFFFYLKTSRKFASFGFFCCIQMRAKHLHFHRIAFCFEFSLIIWFEAMFCSHATQRIDYFICTVFLRRQQWRQQRQTFQFDPKYYRYTARYLNVSSERNHIECDESKLNVT